MADSFGKLVSGINPTTGSGTEEWFSVPAGHQYQGYIRVTHIGASGTAESEYKIYGLAATGDSVTDADLERVGFLNPGDVDDFTFDMGPGETLSVGSDSANITFNYRGLDINGSS